MARIDYGEVLMLFLWGMDKLTRPTMRNLLAGYEEFSHRPYMRNLLRELERQKLVNRTGRGKSASFSITPVGRLRAEQVNPRAMWEQPWDGLWRAFTFDVPESQRKQRVALWKALRARKLGLLQWSVWVWPRAVERILEEIVHAQGIPECFCGFEAQRLFLCTNAEMVQSAWDFEEIGTRQRGYLSHPRAALRAVQRIRDLAELAAHGRAERQAYEYAFSLDPLLPRQLWPRGYKGLEVQERHERFQLALKQCLSKLAETRV